MFSPPPDTPVLIIRIKLLKTGHHGTCFTSMPEHSEMSEKPHKDGLSNDSTSQWVKRSQEHIQHQGEGELTTGSMHDPCVGMWHQEHLFTNSAASHPSETVSIGAPGLLPV